MTDPKRMTAERAKELRAAMDIGHADLSKASEELWYAWEHERAHSAKVEARAEALASSKR